VGPACWEISSSPDQAAFLNWLNKEPWCDLLAEHASKATRRGKAE
jgi:hypothetical protein